MRRSDMSFLSVAISAGLALSACGGTGPAGDSPTAGPTEASRTAAQQSPGTAECTPGGVVKEIGGVQVREFCGPARATVMVGGQTFKITGGECEALGDSFVVNIGTFNGKSLAPPKDYFGIFLESGDGSTVADGAYSGGIALAGNAGATEFSMAANGTVTLKNGLSAGDFEGAVLGSGEISGFFTCN